MRKWLAIILAAAAVVMGGVSVFRFAEEKRAGSEYDSLRQIVSADALSETDSAEAPADKGDTAEESVTASAEETAASSEEETSASSAEQIPPEELPPEVRSIDWEKLKETCPDAYAWIRIKDTEIDYPIVQHPDDNAFYLTHSADGKEAAAGAIFTETFNKKDFSDPNTVIYGHNMKNGSMFRALHQYKDPVFFEEHSEIMILLPDKKLDVKVFAAYTTDNKHQLLSFDVQDPDVFSEYIRQILAQKEMGAVVDSSVNIGKDDRIVTLSTCNGNSEQRYVVQGLIGKDK